MTAIPATPIDMADIRASSRAELFVEVDVASESNFYQGIAENVSEGGLFVATHRLYEVGAIVAVDLSLPGLGRQIRALCEVRWTRMHERSSDEPAGLGLRFLDLGAEDAAAIRDFVEQREPIFWE